MTMSPIGERTSGARPGAPGGGQASPSEAQRRLQARLLERVSRTFALTIPRLPRALVDTVGNAYLLCRVIDTVEDELHVDPDAKDALYADFVAALADAALAAPRPGGGFADELRALLPPDAPAGEIELVDDIPEVLRVTASFRAEERAVLRRCVQVMARGMRGFEALGASGRGLADHAELERYCYHVAGCVGEMLTELFCLHDPAIEARRQRLMQLSVAFGNGLQLTNILKDMWLDHARGVCWLPRDAFELDGASLPAIMDRALAGDAGAVRIVDAGTHRLVGLCRGYLDDAMRYVRTIPREQIGMRVFCLWSIGLSVLTLRKIRRDPVAERRHGTKISRSSVRATLVCSDASAGHERIMSSLYAGACIGLPRAARGVAVRA